MSMPAPSTGSESVRLQGEARMSEPARWRRRVPTRVGGVGPTDQDRSRGPQSSRQEFGEWTFERGPTSRRLARMSSASPIRAPGALRSSRASLWPQDVPPPPNCADEPGSDRLGRPTTCRMPSGRGVSGAGGAMRRPCDLREAGSRRRRAAGWTTGWTTGWTRSTQSGGRSAPRGRYLPQPLVLIPNRSSTGESRVVPILARRVGGTRCGVERCQHVRWCARSR
jgi:hypothetical protein